MFPWPSFSTFQFAQEERAIFGSDTGWQHAPSRARVRPLGASRDQILVMATGSDERSFEVLLSRDRFTALRQYVDATGSFTDWRRPVPDSRDAYLASVEHVEEVTVVCDAVSLIRIRTRISLLSQ